jgi:serine/threonine-protein kinase
VALAPGTRLGAYEILTLIGVGGMGEVYKARDTRLERVVAVKVLSPALVGDAEFRDRFEREARTISQLTHPHICVLHDIGDAVVSLPAPSPLVDRQESSIVGSAPESVRFLVMEYLEGESLAARLERGALPLDDSLRLSVQIARALHAAHRAGIVHRDLKPGNVMLVKTVAASTSAPQAKLLDFGLAKHGVPLAPGVGAGHTGPNLTAPPTMTSPLTSRGSIVGTLHYMSPEQLEGTDADARSDLFGFGAVLFEMISGKKAFAGKSQVSVMAAILDHDPPSVTSLVPSAPKSLERLIAKCLAKDPEARWQNAGDVASELEWIADAAAQRSSAPASTASDPSGDVVANERAGRPLRQRMRFWMIATLVLPLVAASAMWLVMRPGAVARPQPMRFAIVPPAALPLATGFTDRDIAISPDGTKIVYLAGGGQRQLMMRAIDQLDAVPLRGVSTPRAPFFSPDGKWIGYFEGTTELKKVSTSGGPPISLCRIAGGPRGASWSADNTIVFATSDPTTGLLSVPAGGGEPTVLTKPDTARGEQDHWFPEVLPGGRAVLFTITAPSLDTSQVAVLDLKTGQRKTLVRGGTHAQYVESGHLVYAAAGSLRAVSFDPVRLDVLSDPIPVVDQVATTLIGAAEFSVSTTGALLYVPGSLSSELRTLTWVGRNGREEPVKSPPRAYVTLRLSPDDTRVALTINDHEQDIWVLDLSRDPPPLTRLTFDPAQDVAPVWTPDGRGIVFRSARTGTGNLFWRSADGTGADERLTTSPYNQIPMAFSPDGKRLIFTQLMPQTNYDLFTMSADGKGKSEPLVQTPFIESAADLSPDGRWLVHESTESGRNEIYVRPFPDAGAGRWMVSTAGGIRPVWARTGAEIFYVEQNGNALMSVPVRTTPTFSAGTPVKVKVVDAAFYTGAPVRSYDVSRDGQRFLVIKNPPVDQTASATPASMIVVVNWGEELKQRLPTK